MKVEDVGPVLGILNETAVAARADFEQCRGWAISELGKHYQFDEGADAGRIVDLERALDKMRSAYERLSQAIILQRRVGRLVESASREGKSELTASAA